MALTKPSKIKKEKTKIVDGHPCNGDYCKIVHDRSICNGDFIVSMCENCLVTFNVVKAGGEKIKNAIKKSGSKRRKKKKVQLNIFDNGI